MAIKDTEFSVGLTATDEASPAINKVANSAEHAISAIDSLLIKMTGLNQASELLGKAFDYVKDIAKESVGAFLDEENQLHELQLAMRIAGNYSKTAYDQMLSFADGLEASTTATDDQIRAMLRQGQAIGLSIAKTEQMTAVAIDLGAALHKGPEEAFDMLRMATSGQARSLAQFFPELRNLTTEELQAGKATEILAKKLGGFSAEEAKTAHGQTIQLGKAMKNLSEEFGGVIIALTRGEGGHGSPVMAAVLQAVIDLTDALKELGPALIEIHNEVIAFGQAMYDAITKTDWAPILEAVALLTFAVGTVGLAAFASSGGMLALSVSFSAAYTSAMALGGAVLALISNLVILVAESALFIAIAVTWAVAIVGIAVAIDLAIHNMSRLDDVAVITFGNAYKWITKASLALTKMTGFGGDVTEMEADLAELDKRIAKSGDGLDFSISGKAADSVKSFVATLTDGMKKGADATHGVNEELKNIGTGPSGLMPWTKELGKSLDDLTKKSADALLASQRLGNDEIATINVKSQQSIQELNDLTEKIRLTGMLGKKQAELNAISANIKQTRILEIQGSVGKELDKQIKASEEAQRQAELAGLSELDQAKAKFDIDMQAITVLEDRLKSEGALSDQMKTQLSLARQARKEAEKAQISEVNRKANDELQKNIFDGFKKGASAAGQIFSDIMTGAMVDQLGSALEFVANIPDAFIKGIGKLDQAINNMLNAFPKLIQTVLNKLPNIAAKFVEAAPKIAESIAAAIPMIAQAMANAIPPIIRAIVQALPMIIRAIGDGIAILIEQVPDILSSIVAGLPDIITALLRDALPKVVIALIRGIPEMVKTLLDNIGPVIEAFVTGFIDATAEIAMAFAETFWRYSMDPTILMKIGLKISVGIVQGFIKGIIHAFRDIMKMFGGKFKLPGISNLATDFKNAVGDLKKIIGGDTSKLFNVTDLTDSAKGFIANTKAQIDELLNEAEQIGKTIWQAFIDAYHEGVAWLQELGGQIWGGFITGLNNGISYVKQLGALIWEGLIAAVNPSSFVDWGRGVWEGIQSAAGDPIAYFRNLGASIWAGFLGAGDIFGTFFGMGRTVWSGMVSAFDRNAFSGFGHQIAEQTLDRFNHLMGDIGNVGRNIATAFLDKIRDFDWGSLIPNVGGGGGGGEGALGKIFGHAGGVIRAHHYATGGFVDPLPFSPIVEMAPRGLDRVPIMTQPGEMVMNRRAVANNLDTLTTMNTGGSQQNGGNTFYITVRSDLDADSVRRNIVPEVERVLKRKSQDGGFVIAKTGIRE